MALPSRILRRIPTQPLATTVARHNFSRLASRMVSSRRGPAISRRAAGRMLKAGGRPYAQGGQQSGPGAYPGGYPGMQGQPYGQQPNGQPHQPHYYHGIDLNDPNQNPLYGHWDSYAIISFILALFFPVPVLSALMGAVAMWRTRTFHMKGFGLAVAAVVINVLYTIAVIWMAFNGYDAMSLYQEALQQLTGGTGSSSDSISA